MQEWYADLMDDGIINREHLFDPWQEFTDNDLKERKKDEGLLLSDRKKLINQKLEENKKAFTENFEMKKAYMIEIGEKTGITDPADYNLYIECAIMGRTPTAQEAEKLEKLKAIPGFHEHMLRLHELNTISFDTN